MAKKDAAPDVLPFHLATSIRPDSENLVWVNIERIAAWAGCHPDETLAALRQRGGMLLLSMHGRWFVAYERAKLAELGIDYKG